MASMPVGHAGCFLLCKWFSVGSGWPLDPFASSRLRCGFNLVRQFRSAACRLPLSLHLLGFANASVFLRHPADVLFRVPRMRGSLPLAGRVAGCVVACCLCARHALPLRPRQPDWVLLHCLGFGDEPACRLGPRSRRLLNGLALQYLLQPDVDFLLFLSLAVLTQPLCKIGPNARL